MQSEAHNNAFPYQNRVPLLGYPVDDYITTLEGNRLVCLIQLKGIPHQMREVAELDEQLTGLNRYFLSLGKKAGRNLMLQAYTTKARVEMGIRFPLSQPSLQSFVDEYVDPFRKGRYLTTGYSLALVLKYRDLDDGIGLMRELIELSRTMLALYDPSFMGVEETHRGTLYSQLGRFYSRLLNGYEQDILVCDTRLGDQLIDSVTSFDQYDFVVNRPNRGGERYATTFDLRDYPAGGSTPGMWDEAIEQPFAFTLVQTFLFEDRNKAKDAFNKHIADLGSVEGDSKQTKELEKAVEAITLGEKQFGRYFASLIVYGDTPDEAVDNGSSMASLFEVRDTTFKKSTLSSPDTWLTQFPGVTEAMYPMMKSTENLACCFSLHSSPSGKAKGNPIGDGSALMPMRTVDDGMFMLNPHDSPLGQNNLGEALPGHITINGQSGVGKTTLEGIMLTFLSRWDPALFCIDYNESNRNVLEALDTPYFAIAPGELTGINPFQFSDSQALRQLLLDLVLCCAGGKSKTDDQEQVQIEEAIAAVMNSQDVRKRGMSLLLQCLTASGGNSLHTRLSKWARHAGGREGQYAWVLDSPVNRFDPSTYRRLAFDCTHVLSKEYATKHPEVLEVLLNTLFFMKRTLHAAQPGSLLINLIAEYWVPLSFDSTGEAIKEILKAGRLRGEMLIMDTQSPEDALSTPHAPAVIQQTVTAIWLPNDKATAEVYAKVGVRGRLFETIRAMPRQSRQMVVVQGERSVQLKLALDERQKYWLPLFSSTPKNVAVAKRIRELLGTDHSGVWVPAFLIAEAVRQWLNTEDPDVWVPAFKLAYPLALRHSDPTAEGWMRAFQDAWHDRDQRIAI